MRYAVIVLALAAGACAQKGPLTQAYEEYTGCLSTRPAAECENARLKFEAAKGYADSASRRMEATPPLILSTYQPGAVAAPRQPITCTTLGSTTTCN